MCRIVYHSIYSLVVSLSSGQASCVTSCLTRTMIVVDSAAAEKTGQTPPGPVSADRQNYLLTHRLKRASFLLSSLSRTRFLLGRGRGSGPNGSTKFQFLSFSGAVQEPVQVRKSTAVRNRQQATGALPLLCCECCGDQVVAGSVASLIDPLSACPWLTPQSIQRYGICKRGNTSHL